MVRPESSVWVNPVKQRLRITLMVVAIQYGTIGLGCFFGFGMFYRPPLLVAVDFRQELGALAMLAVFAEMLRFRRSKRLRQPHPWTWLLCGALFLYIAWIYDGVFRILDGPSLEYSEDPALVGHLLLLTPLLGAIGPLVRSKAWVGLASVILFSTTVLSILIYNGFHNDLGIGFFSSWVA